MKINFKSFLVSAFICMFAVIANAQESAPVAQQDVSEDKPSANVLGVDELKSLLFGKKFYYLDDDQRCYVQLETKERDAGAFEMYIDCKKIRRFGEYRIGLLSKEGKVRNTGGTPRICFYDSWHTLTSCGTIERKADGTYWLNGNKRQYFFD